MMAAVIAAMTLGELLGPAAGSHEALAVTDLVSDSREVTAGSAFVAVAGATHHGLEFAGRAVSAGAAVILHDGTASTQHHGAGPDPGVPVLEVAGIGSRLGELGRAFYGRAVPEQRLLGVTGTNGKTTVAWLVAQALTALDQPCGYLGTLGHGTPDALKPQALTTPDCLGLHRALAQLGTPNAALEISSHALEQDRIAGLELPVGAFTNLSRDHLDWHGTMEAYFNAKAGLFTRPEMHTAVINADDAYAQALIGRLGPATRPLTAGFTAADARLRGALLTSSLSGIELEIRLDAQCVRLHSPLIGTFNAENLLLAAGVLTAAGNDLDVACAALATAPPPPGRMQVFGGGAEAPWVVVDFAHTPRALERVLADLGGMTDGALTCVFGCGGERDRGKRRLMGEAAARYAAHVVLTDDNPRSEDPLAIIADIKAGIVRHPDLRVQHSRELAIGEAIAAAGSGDVVLIAGKGHEQVQWIAGTAHPFDDRAVVRRALEGLS